MPLHIRNADCHPDRKHCARGQCAPCYHKSKPSRDKGKCAEYMRSYRSRSDVQDRMRLKEYGMPPGTYQSLYQSQNRVCAICGRRKSLVVDHAHDTRMVRGLLCFRCNFLIGYAKDDPDILRAAIMYLEKSR